MPNEDVRVVLVDERGKERDTTYLTKRHGLSAGWRGFAMEHRLLEGDILVFHMISPYRFKVIFFVVRYLGFSCTSSTLNYFVNMQMLALLIKLIFVGYYSDRLRVYLLVTVDMFITILLKF